jgi:hypothetical protein
MRIQVLAAAVAVATLVTGSSVQAQSNYYAALAIDHNAGDGYGWAVNHYTQKQADAAALSQCGRNCRVVVRFYGGCGAYAVEPGNDSLYGWGTASTEYGAKSRAEQEVRARGARSTVIRVWGCNAG